MILFFLGSERYFDRRYLRKNHVHVTQQGLGFDIIVLIVTSGWFVLLAESFPKTLGVSIKQDIINSRFLTNLYILYIIDLVILIIQVVRTHLTMEKSLNRDKIILAHYGWIISNMLFIMAFSPYIFNKWKMPSPESIWIMLGTAHLARFILDFGYAFPFYYPVDEESMAE
jgi:hypothetical protein